MDEFLCCQLCCENFHEDTRKPHVLPCGHHYCAVCIDDLGKRGSGNITCPNCRGAHQGSSAKDFPVNYGVQSLIGKCTKSLSISSIIKSESGTNSDEEQNLLEYAKSQMLLFDNMYSQMEEYKYTMLKNEEKHAEVASKFETLMSLNISLKDKFRSEYDNICQKQNEMENMWKELKPKILDLDKQPEKMNSVTDVEFESLSKKVMTAKNWLKASTESIPCVSLLISSQQTLDKSLDSLSLWDSKQEHSTNIPSVIFDPKLTLIEKTNFVKENVVKGLTILKAEELSTSRGQELCKNGQIYAIQCLEGNDDLIQRYAKISFEDGKYFLHCLEDGKPPENAYRVKHDELIKMVEEQEEIQVFMNISRYNTRQGQVIFNLFEPMKYLGLQFRTLCTGDFGPSYKKTKLFDVWDKGNSRLERIRGGDYEANNGEAGQAIIKIGSRTTTYPLVKGTRYPLVKGALRAFWNDGPKGAQFWIMTGTGDNSLHDEIFGQTVKGIKVLDVAAKNICNGGVFVEDCGVIIPI